MTSSWGMIFSPFLFKSFSVRWRRPGAGCLGGGSVGGRREARTDSRGEPRPGGRAVWNAPRARRRTHASNRQSRSQAGEASHPLGVAGAPRRPPVPNSRIFSSSSGLGSTATILTDLRSVAALLPATSSCLWEGRIAGFQCTFLFFFQRDFECDCYGTAAVNSIE